MISRTVNFISRPVVGSPLFFPAATLAAASAPLALAALQGEIGVHCIVYALTQSAVGAYLLSALSLLPHCRGLKVAFGILLGLWAAVEAGLVATIGHPVDVAAVSLVGETTWRESCGFFSQFVSVAVVLKTLGFLLSMAVAAWFCSLLIRRIWAVCRPLLAAVTLLVLAFGVAGIVRCLSVLGIPDYDSYLVWQSSETGVQWVSWGDRIERSDAYTKAVYLAKSMALEKAETDAWLTVQRSVAASDYASNGPEELDIAVIIGESFIKSHSSLYGYELDTNPRLAAEADSGRLTVFTDMITAANFTTPSIRNLMNLNRIADGERWSSAPYWPLVLARAGWRVSLFSNQFVPGSSGVGLEGMMCHPLLMERCYEVVADKNFAFDGDFVDYVCSGYKASAPGRNLVLWHLYGQHFPSYARYPHTPANERFAADDIKADKPWLTEEMRREVAEYANATLYNDSVVAGILDLYRRRPAIVIYFSDHGEEMWDSAPYGARNSQHPEDEEWMKRQFDVPFFVWVSDTLAASQPALVNRIREAACRRGILDDLGQMVLGVAGADSTVYDSRRDILSADYECPPRITSAAYHYDD
ncbi:MAG: phosphoethanolamine transferase [Muribaculaceae bacterium]|nr:phosphoethanolamine transferase [Muribaculaceae bacterium]